MPIRIKPVHDLGPCVLTFEDIQKITELVDKEFPKAFYSANDNLWEIYDEPSQSFVAEIAKRNTLD